MSREHPTRHEMYQRGYSDRQIAHVDNVTPSAIGQWRRVRGLAPQRGVLGVDGFEPPGASYVPLIFQLPAAEAAYAAGIVDGEGCIIIARHRGRTTPTVSVSNTNRPLLEWLRERFGGSIHRVRRLERHHKPRWYWSCAGITRTLGLAEALLPYMIVKRDQMTVLEHFCRDRVEYLRRVGKVAAEVRPVDHKYREMISRLNAA